MVAEDPFLASTLPVPAKISRLLAPGTVEGREAYGLERESKACERDVERRRSSDNQTNRWRPPQLYQATQLVRHCVSSADDAEWQCEQAPGRVSDFISSQDKKGGTPWPANFFSLFYLWWLQFRLAHCLTWLPIEILTIRSPSDDMSELERV